MAQEAATAAHRGPGRASPAGRWPECLPIGASGVAPVHRTDRTSHLLAGSYAMFRDELARRMPALNAAMTALSRGHNVDLASAIRDAHMLASGSAALGETSAAAALRHVERALASPQAEHDVGAIAEQLTGAWVALSGWLPGWSGPAGLDEVPQDYLRCGGDPNSEQSCAVGGGGATSAAQRADSSSSALSSRGS